MSKATAEQLKKQDAIDDMAIDAMADISAVLAKTEMRMPPKDYEHFIYAVSTYTSRLHVMLLSKGNRDA